MDHQNFIGKMISIGKKKHFLVGKKDTIGIINYSKTYLFPKIN